MRRALVILGALVVTTLATLFIAPILIDWDRYRGTIEEEASRLAGREVRIGGQINVRLLPVPTIHIGRLRIADTTAAIGEPLFKAEAVRVRLSLSPLIAGAIEARQVDLTNPVVNLVLDDKGGGNWASLAHNGGSLPDSVSFDDVRISDGSLVVRATNGSVKAQFNQIAGTISATALEGPYRVALTYAEPDAKGAAGAASSQGVRELRFSTARQDADGGVRFKGTVRSPASGMSWALDGTAFDLLGRVRVDGALTARIPFVRSDAASARGRGSAPPAVVEVKSSLRADTAAMELADFTLTIDADNKPQLANGAARFSWGELTTAEILVKARWIDIDRIIGTDADTASTATLTRMIAGFGDALPGTDQLRALVLLDQATLNGDVISALKADIQKNAAGYEIRELSGNLPGSARLILSGRLTPENDDKQFEGPVTLRGASFNRFIAWAGRGLQPPEIAQDGPFALDGQLAVGPKHIGAQDIRVEVPGGRLGGDARWSWGSGPTDAASGASPAIALALDGPSLDIGALLPNEPRPAALIRDILSAIAVPAPGERPASTAKPANPWPSADVKLRFGRLATRAGIYHDVDAELRWDGKSWKVPRLHAAGAAGWRVELEGDLAGFNEANPAGTVAGILTSPDRAAFADFLSLLEIPQTGILEPDRLARISPTRLAGRLTLKPKSASEPASARLTVDGDAGESRIAAVLSTPRRGGSLHDQPLEIDVRADSPAITSLLAQVTPDGWIAPAAARIAVPARLTFAAVGQLGAGLQTLAALESAGLRAELRGRLKAPAGGTPDLAGTIQLRADDLAHLLATTALGGSPRLAGLPVTGQLALALNDKRLKLETDDLTIADARLRGTIDLDFTKPVKRLDAKLTSSRVELTRALIPILDERLAAAVQTPQRVEAPSWWPEAPFDFDRLSTIEGTIALDTPEFVVANGIALRNARIDTTIRPGTLDIRLAEANAGGGKAAGRFTLAKAPAGVTLKGALRIDGADLGPGVATNTPPPVGGRVQLIVDVSGSALTARGLVASLSGTGEVRLFDTVLNHLSPSAITEASAIVLGPEGTLGPGSLEKLLRERLSGEPLQLGRRRIALTISDGHVRTAPLVAETKAGRVNGTLIIDLDSQRIDSEWKLDGATVHPRKGAKPKGPLPAVTIIWAGPLARLASIEPQIQVDALERELSVRRMEGEVDELERLRKLDEDRAREEAERQRVQELERQREAARFLDEQRAREAERASPVVPLPAAPGSPAPLFLPNALPTSPTEPGSSADPAATAVKEGDDTPAAEQQQAAPPPRAPTRPSPRPQARKRPFNPFGDGFSQ